MIYTTIDGSDPKTMPQDEYVTFFVDQFMDRLYSKGKNGTVLVFKDFLDTTIAHRSSALAPPNDLQRYADVVNSVTEEYLPKVFKRLEANGLVGVETIFSIIESEVGRRVSVADDNAS